MGKFYKGIQLPFLLDAIFWVGKWPSTQELEVSKNFVKKRKKYLTNVGGGGSISGLSEREALEKESKRNLQENEKSS